MQIYYDGFGLCDAETKEFIDEMWVDPASKRSKRDYPYSYSEFFHTRSVSCEELKACHAVYSDRLNQWNGEKYLLCFHDDGFLRGDISKKRSDYFDKNVEVKAVAEGCNPSTGFPYFIIWYK